MPIYAFQSDRFRLDPAKREMRADGALVALAPKAFDVLVYLLQHRDRAVGRDELADAVWGKADVSDDMLGQLIRKARRAVNDDGSRQHVLRTVPRFGYRWVAAVEVLDPLAHGTTIAQRHTVGPAGRAAAPNPEPFLSAAPPPSTQQPRKWRMALLLLVAAVLIAALAGLALRSV